jgi:hypothetical protein
MNSYIYLLIALAFATTLGYLMGKKRNKAIGAMIGDAAEHVLKPQKTNYVNIGGVLGHNFTYDLDAPFTEAKGTFTLLPRHSVFYMPLSLLISRHDRFYLHLFTKNDLLGEGHIIAERYFPKMRVDIAGIDKLKKETVPAGGKNFILLWDNPHLKDHLLGILNEVKECGDLLHFCCFRDNKNFFLYVIPKPDSIVGLLEGIWKKLPGMMKQAN